MVVLKIYKTLCGSINIESLIKSRCFNIKSSQFHVFFSNFSRVRLFCDDDCLKLVPESMCSRVYCVIKCL